MRRPLGVGFFQFITPDDPEKRARTNGCSPRGVSHGSHCLLRRRGKLIDPIRLARTAASALPLVKRIGRFRRRAFTSRAKSTPFIPPGIITSEK
jgi:hypothetical protein